MRNTILVITGFAFYYIGFKYFEAIMLFLNKAIQQTLISYLLTYIVIGIPIFIITCLLNKSPDFFRFLGLRSNILKGLFVGIVFSLPMFIGGYTQSKLIDNISLPDMIAKTIFAGFFEELYFRGFFFGQLFRKTKLGFLPAIILCSLVFAAGHLYQSQEPGVLAGVFMTTFMGSVLFAWLYVEWNYNLWVPVFLHTFMNLSWYIFSISDNALGTVNSNLFRGLTIAISIMLTLVYKKRKGEKLLINRTTLWAKKNYEE